jgi:GTPase Era involved in 16S rRNA processing
MKTERLLTREEMILSVGDELPSLTETEVRNIARRVSYDDMAKLRRAIQVAKSAATEKEASRIRASIG